MQMKISKGKNSFHWEAEGRGGKKGTEQEMNEDKVHTVYYMLLMFFIFKIKNKFHIWY